MKKIGKKDMMKERERNKRSKFTRKEKIRERHSIYLLGIVLRYRDSFA
jgi:hypothetical protein